MMKIRLKNLVILPQHNGGYAEFYVDRVTYNKYRTGIFNYKQQVIGVSSKNDRGEESLLINSTHLYNRKRDDFKFNVWIFLDADL